LVRKTQLLQICLVRKTHFRLGLNGGIWPL